MGSRPKRAGIRGFGMVGLHEVNAAVSFGPGKIRYRALVDPTRAGFDAGWSSPVAGQAHDLKVVGSNPAPAINSRTPSAKEAGVLAFRELHSRLAAPAPLHEKPSE